MPDDTPNQRYNLFLVKTFSKCMKSMLKVILVSLKICYFACHFNVLLLINQSIKIENVAISE